MVIKCQGPQMLGSELGKSNNFMWSRLDGEFPKFDRLCRATGLDRGRAHDTLPKIARMRGPCSAYQRSGGVRSGY